MSINERTTYKVFFLKKIKQRRRSVWITRKKKKRGRVGVELEFLRRKSVGSQIVGFGKALKPEQQFAKDSGQNSTGADNQA